MQRACGNHEAATVSYRRALRLFRDLSNSAGEAQVLNSMGELSHAIAAAPAQALALFQEALTIATRLASLPEEARAREGIARCHLQSGNHDLASTYLQQARKIYQQIGSPRARHT